LLKKMPDPLWEEFKHFYGFTSLYTAKGMKEALRKAGFSTAFHTTLHPFRPASTINPIASYASFGVTEWNQLIKNNDLL
ncbi:hypothetical protein, partial [Acinetobacter baumannii]|uniref:hypothetical protein n=1 Tax=Acinetobacter baumannii TaxID=470 RepID=UPI000AA1385F